MVKRTSNHNARPYVERLMDFRANNLSGRNIGNLYIVMTSSKELAV